MGSYHARRPRTSAGLAIAVSFLLSGCDVPRDICDDPPQESGAIAFSCGELRPGLEVSCDRDGDALSPTVFPGAEAIVMQPGVSVSDVVAKDQSDEACDAPVGHGTRDEEWARIDVVAASLAARCDVAPGEGSGFVATIRLVGAASQLCHRSSSLVAPEWRGHIAIPEGVHRLRVDAEVELDLERWTAPGSAGCIAYVDGDPGDPLLEPASRVATRYVTGPKDVPVAIVCPRLAGQRCYRGDEEEGSTRRMLGVTYRVERVE